MRPTTRANLIWPGMILAGAALAFFVFLSWPEPTFRLVRLPYGESMPKTPAAALERAKPVRVAKSAPAPAPVQDSVPASEIASEPQAERELAAVEPAKVVEPVKVPDGPVPTPAADEDDGYIESAEQLGATPLPGMYPDAPVEESPSSDPLLGSLIGLAPQQ